MERAVLRWSEARREECAREGSADSVLGLGGTEQPFLHSQLSEPILEKEGTMRASFPFLLIPYSRNQQGY